MIRVISVILAVTAVILCIDAVRKKRNAVSISLLVLALLNAVFAIYDSYYTFYFAFRLLTSEYPLYRPESFYILGVEDHIREVTIANCAVSILIIILSRTFLRFRFSNKRSFQ